MDRSYESVIIIDPNVSNAVVNEIVGHVKDIVTNSGGVIVAEENMGIRHLSYEIKHKKNGIYYLFEFECAPNLIKDLETMYRRNEKIIRFLTCALDVHGVEYNKNKRNTKKNEQDLIKNEVSL